MNFDRLAGDLYKTRLEDQLGVKLERDENPTERKEYRIYESPTLIGVVIDAWRRPPRHPNWSVNVSYGDPDMAICGENKETAIAYLEKEINALKQAQEWIKENISGDNSESSL